MESRLKRVRGYGGSNTYTPLNEDEEEQENLLGSDTLVLGNLHPKKRGDWSPARSPKDQTLECDIQPSDTLATLSLKYNVPLAELKRVNNIINEAEFYALKRLKIPVKTASFINDLLPEVHSEERRTNNNGWYLETKESPQQISSGISSHVSSGYSSPCSESDTDRVSSVFHESKDTKKVKRFLKDMDKDLDRIRERQSDIVTSTNPSTPQILLNGEVRKHPLRASQLPTEDPGCSNRTLGCWCLIVGILIMIVFCFLVGLMRIQHDKESLSSATEAVLQKSLVDANESLGKS